MSIRDNREEIIEGIQEGLGAVASGEPMSELGPTMELLCTQLQALGICNALAALDAEGFRRNLALSAMARAFFLRKSREQKNVDDVHLAISRTDAVLDAIAIGAVDLAKEIVADSAKARVPDGEYEEDYGYFAFVHEIVASDFSPKAERLEALLESYEAALDGNFDDRLDLCKAVAEKDEKAFWDAFDVVLSARQREASKPPTSDDPWEEPRRHVWVQGLAWLQIAKRLGFDAPSSEYPLCPSVCRPADVFQAPNDVFRQLERERNL